MTQLVAQRLKLGLALIVPLLLYGAVAERASWRPRIFHYKDDVRAIAYSRDERWLVCATNAMVELRDARTAQLVRQDKLGDDALKALAFSPDNQTLALSRNDSLQLWDVPTHKLRYDLLAHYPYWHNARALLFTPDGARLITGGDESQTLLWDTHTGKLLRTLSNDKTVVPEALSTNARMLALLALDRSDTYVRLWKVATGQTQSVLRPPPGHNACCAAFAPDHKTVAMGMDNGEISFWDIATGRQTRRFVAHTAEVFHLAFSPPGQLLASSGNEVKIWDVRTGALLRTLYEPKDSVINDLTFAPDGTTLAVACGQTAQLWRMQ